MFNQIVSKIYHSLVTVVTLSFLLIVNPLLGVVAQEETSSIDESLIETNPNESSEPESSQEETLTTELQTTQELDPNQVDYFKKIIPFAKFLNYQYIGMEANFEKRDVIMEYMPDANGVFQVASITDNQAVAYIYQIRPDGLYELASFTEYFNVEDLRYSEDAMDQQMSLILPLNLAKGTVFHSGYHQEIEKKIVDMFTSVTIGESIYRDVVVVEEVDSNPQDILRSYYAAEGGLILVERIQSNGEISTVMYLNSTQGALLN